MPGYMKGGCFKHLFSRIFQGNCIFTLIVMILFFKPLVYTANESIGEEISEDSTSKEVFDSHDEYTSGLTFM